MSGLPGTPIYLTLAGSHAHGTARATSDLDLRGVVVLPLARRISLRPLFEHAEGPVTASLMDLIEPWSRRDELVALAQASKGEYAVDELAKFLTLCAAANPSALEVLFTDERHWLVATPAWRRVHAERHRLLTRKVRETFMGYALAQLHRIKSHRAWLLEPPKAKPARAAFGLPEHGALLDRDQRNRLEQSLAEKLRRYGVDELEMPRDTRIALRERLLGLMADTLECSEEEVEEAQREVAAVALGLPRELITALNAEKRYQAAMRHWESYQSWLAHRHPQRAELERRYGYDTKHAMHLVRLMRMGLEALREGTLTVERPDAEELRSIRDGALSYDEILALSAELEAQMSEAATVSRLPVSVDLDTLDALLFDVVSEVG